MVSDSWTPSEALRHDLGCSLLPTSSDREMSFDFVPIPGPGSALLTGVGPMGMFAGRKGV
jgi:hypothetical protein